MALPVAVEVLLEQSSALEKINIDGKSFLQLRTAQIPNLSQCQDLVDDLKGELGGKFETLIVGLMSSPIAYDVKCLRDAIKVSALILRGN